ncbi:MAG: hypothetical protein ACOYN4_19225 [Bacteroidales bacterium]
MTQKSISVSTTIYCFGFIFVLLLSHFTVFSQDISKYLDDGGFSTSKKIIKIGFDPINGFLPILFEHALGKHISLEWSAGLVSLQRQNWLYSNNPLPIGSKGLGYTFSGSMKIFLKSFPERSYIAFKPGISIMSRKIYTDIVAFNYGYQRPIHGKWLVAGEIGIGVRLFKNTTMFGGIDYTDNESRFLIPVSIKTGYLF